MPETRFDCPTCGKRLRVAAGKGDMAGRRIRCPGCGKVSDAPAARLPVPPLANDRIVVTCPCGKRLAAPPEAAGKQVRCPDCGATIPVPDTRGCKAGAEEQQSPWHPPCPNCGRELVVVAANGVEMTLARVLFNPLSGPLAYLPPIGPRGAASGVYSAASAGL